MIIGILLQLARSFVWDLPERAEHEHFSIDFFVWEVPARVAKGNCTILKCCVARYRSYVCYTIQFRITF